MTDVRHNVWSRVLLFIFVVALTIPLLPMTALRASAETPELPFVRVEDKTVHRGQTFELNVYLDSNPGLVAMILELSYDKTAMELIGVQRGNALKSHTFTTTNTETEDGFLVEPFRLLWDGTVQDKTTGLLVTFTFESKITAPIGEYPVTLDFDRENTNSQYGMPIDVEIDNGLVTLISGEYTVVYKNYDGTELERKDYNADQIPTYTKPTPTRPTDEMYSYTFSGWRGAVSTVEKEIWYVADYEKTPQPYQVTFYVDGEYFHGDIYGYGELVDLSYIPSLKNHNFSGWYADENFTQKVTLQRMPAHDIILYGYMKYNIREDDIPQLTLSVDRIENGVAFVNVDVTRNPSIAGLVLTLDYDRTALEFIGFEKGGIFGAKQFFHTNIENGYGADPFKFSWEHLENSYELGTLLTLKFKINATVPAGLYGVTVTYNENTDATYMTDEQELWYTRLEIVGADVPIGKIYHWYEETQDGIGIDVTTTEGQSPDTVLEIKRVSHLIALSKESVLSAAGENMELKDIYAVRLMRGGKEVRPNGKITLKIELTEAQAGCATIMVFHLDGEENLTFYNSRVEGGFVVIETEHLSNWALIGNSIGGVGGNGQSPANIPILIIAPLLLAMATMGLALVLIARSIKKKHAFTYTKDE